MLSAKYHITYWTAAAGAVAVYRLLALHPLWITVCRLVIGPLAAYTTYASFMWDHHGKKKGRAGLYIHQAFVAWLLVTLGSLMDYFQLPSEDVPKPLALLHVLSAFVAVGVLESVRQNRRDIEPANHLLIYCGPRTAFHYLPLRCLPAKLLSTLLCDAILFGIMPVAELVLREAGGMSLQPLVRYWFVEGMQRPGLLGSAVVAFYLGGPFADMAETIFYALCRAFGPYLAVPDSWKPKLLPLRSRIPFFPFVFPRLEICEQAIFLASDVLIDWDENHDSAWWSRPSWGVLICAFLRVSWGQACDWVERDWDSRPKLD